MTGRDLRLMFTTDLTINTIVPDLAPEEMAYIDMVFNVVTTRMKAVQDEALADLGLSGLNLTGRDMQQATTGLSKRQWDACQLIAQKSKEGS